MAIADRVASKYVSRRVAARYMNRVARQDKISPWGGEQYYWPRTPGGWDDEDEISDNYGMVDAKTFVDDEGDTRVYVDFTPWTHLPEGAPESRGKINYKIEFFGKTKSGTLPLKGYERSIIQLLAEAKAASKKEEANLVKKLEGFGGPKWKSYGYQPGDLSFEYKNPNEYSDASLVVTFNFPLEVASGKWKDAEVDIHFSAGSDYEGHFGQQAKHMKYRDLKEIPRILKEAEKLWDQWVQS